jgi:hypothetical protein
VSFLPARCTPAASPLFCAHHLVHLLGARMSQAGHTERLEAAVDGKYRIEGKLGEGGMASVLQVAPTSVDGPRL